MSPHQRAVPVVVWGGGTGGVAAALQAARSGVETVLLTPGPWLGGMVSAAGVCCPDGNELSPWQTGLWGAFLRALAAATTGGLDHNWVSCFGYRPATAEAILRSWVEREARLSWWPLARLEGVERQGERLAALAVRWRGEDWRLEPTVVVDGSDRGDLYPLAGAPHRLGWEARETWQEPSAPPRAALEADPFFRRQPVQSPTWVVMAQLAAGGEGLDGAGGEGLDGAPPPAAPFAEATRRFGLERTLTYGRLPGGLLMLNWPLAGNDWHDGLERAFAEGLSPGAVPENLAADMRDHSQAFAEALREIAPGRLERAKVFPTAETAAAGSLEGSEDLALMPYWREGRRLVALDTVIEQQLLPLAPGAAIGPLSRDGEGRLTAIAVGNYANDHHYPGPDWPLAPKSCRWGGPLERHALHPSLWRFGEPGGGKPPGGGQGHRREPHGQRRHAPATAGAESGTGGGIGGGPLRAPGGAAGGVAGASPAGGPDPRP